MRKALRIVAVSAGIVSVVSAVVLGCIYFEDITGQLKVYKTNLFKKINMKKYIGEEYDHD